MENKLRLKYRTKYTLLPHQEEFLPAIEWLISDHNRGSGKTFLLAWAYVDKAIKQWGNPVYVVDHYPARSQEFLMREIEKLLINANLEYTMRKRDNCFVVRHPIVSPYIEEK